MSEKRGKNRIRFGFQIALPILCALWVGFIFSNSLKNGEQSSLQSSNVVAMVQRMAQILAPDSWIATATGEAYVRLHHWVRKLAHFTEFAVWGWLLFCCYFAYTMKKRWIWLPVIGVIVLPILDELLQKFVSGRAGMFTDVLIDLAGGIVGFCAAWGLFSLIIWLHAKRKI